MYKYKTKGVCCREINFEITDNQVSYVDFVSGCPGNLLGIKKLVEGLSTEEIIETLEGLTCGNKNTSCPDQFTKALRELVL